MNTAIVATPDAMTARSTTSGELLSASQLLILQTWFSPAFPTGAFAYSHGLESAIADDHVIDTESLYDWLEAIVACGSGWNDAVLMRASWVAAHEQNWQTLQEIDTLAQALPAGAERDYETRSMGASFAHAARVWVVGGDSNSQGLGPDMSSSHPLSSLNALPVISGAAAGMLGLPLNAFISAAMQSSTANLVWIAARLIPLGQTEALASIARLAPAIEQVARRASASTLDDLGGCALMADIASIRHETQQTRICRT